MKQETAARAAKWWADQLRGHAKLDHGDSSPAGMRTKMAAEMCQAAKEPHQSEKVKAFEEALIDILMPIKTSRIFLNVDYRPGPILSQAAQQAGIELSMTDLPWKTVMRIMNDIVKVACGYGASFVTL